MAFSRAAAVRGAALADCTNNAVAIRELKVRAAKSALMLLFHRASQGARAPYPSRTSCRSRGSRARYVYLGANSDEAARGFRDDVAQDSDMMSPGVWRLAGG